MAIRGRPGASPSALAPLPTAALLASSSAMLSDSCSQVECCMSSEFCLFFILSVPSTWNIIWHKAHLAGFRILHHSTEKVIFEDSEDVSGGRKLKQKKQQEQMPQSRSITAPPDCVLPGV
ncbi:uncharacterized protein LOC144302455 [Canis aureus]